jgi:hypothetical protein
MHAALPYIVVIILLALGAAVIRRRRSPADRQWRRTLGRDGRRAIRRAAREDRKYKRREHW